MLSSFSSGYICSANTISENSGCLLAPGITSHKVWCQARAFVLPVPQAGKMPASKLARYFSSHPAAFGFSTSSPPDNISLNLAARQHHESVMNMSPVRLAWMVASAGNRHRLTTNPPLECPSLQPLWGMPEPSKRLGSGLMYRNSLCWSLVVPPCQRSHALMPSLAVVRKLVGGESRSSTDSRKKRSCGGWHSWCITVFVVQVGTFPNSWINGGALLPIGLCLMWWRFTIFSLCTTLHYSISSDN